MWSHWTCCLNTCVHRDADLLRILPITRAPELLQAARRTTHAAGTVLIRKGEYVLMLCCAVLCYGVACAAYCVVLSLWWGGRLEVQAPSYVVLFESIYICLFVSRRIGKVFYVLLSGVCEISNGVGPAKRIQVRCVCV